MALDTALSAIGAPPGGSNSLLANVISQDTLAALDRANDQIKKDQQHLVAISSACQVTDAVKIADQITALRADWAQNPPGLIQALQTVKNNISAVATGHFATVFDVAMLEDELRKVVADLIPARVTLTYDFDTELSDFPSSDPIFAMDRENFSSDGREMGELLRNDLDLRTRIRGMDERFRQPASHRRASRSPRAPMSIFWS